MSGSIAAVGNTAGKILLGAAGQGNSKAKFIPDFIVSGSIDDVLDHVASVRFGSGSETFLTFQNNTTINSTLIYCRAVGLYDANAQLLAVAKLSRPVEKNDEKDLAFRVRLDF